MPISSAPTKKRASPYSCCRPSARSSTTPSSTTGPLGGTSSMLATTYPSKSTASSHSSVALPITSTLQTAPGRLAVSPSPSIFQTRSQGEAPDQARTWRPVCCAAANLQSVIGNDDPCLSAGRRTAFDSSARPELHAQSRQAIRAWHCYIGSLPRSKWLKIMSSSSPLVIRACAATMVRGTTR